ncbi:Hypothetical protein D9617_3g022160 [Elsinoe fawcettii]|nr:Hypothetical protein D9617_3g022160 [Elsinoe fawcettii]
MSSRLLTMKFMQRAAASSPTHASLNSPSSTQAPSADHPPPTKKQRLSNGVSLPSTPASSRRETEQERMVRETLEAENAKRDEALERLGREKGETRWVLSTPVSGPGAGAGGQGDGEAGEGSGFRTVGLGELDREDSEEEAVGRRTFGRPIKVRGRPGKEEEGKESGDSEVSKSESESASESEREEGPEDVDAMIQRGRSDAADRARREMKEKRRDQGRQGSRMAKERRGREVNLNSPRGGRGGGISSGGGAARGGRGGGFGGKRKIY